MLSNTKRRYKILSNGGLRAIEWLVSILPCKIVRVILGPFLEIGYLFLKKLRLNAEETIKVMLKPARGYREIRMITKQCFKNIGLGMIDLISFCYHPKEMSKNVHIEGREYLDKILVDKSGGVIVTAHFGNFPLMFMKLSQEGYKVNVIVRPMRDSRLESFLTGLSERCGVNMIPTLPKRALLKRTIKALNNNELLFLLVDQDYEKQASLPVNFLGKRMHMTMGPVSFALRKKAAIYSMFIIQYKKQCYKIIIEPQSSQKQLGKEPQDIENYITRLIKTIEGYIMQYPEQWGGWLNRKWKASQS